MASTNKITAKENGIVEQRCLLSLKVMKKLLLHITVRITKRP